MEREEWFEIMAQGPREPLVALVDRLLEQEDSGEGEGQLEIMKDPKGGGIDGACA